MDHAELVAHLESRRHELRTELNRLTRPPEPGSTVSFGKRVGDGTTEAVERLSTTVVARSVAESLADVERALAKAEAGTYGTCDDCGEEIPAERLEARPTATRCVTCSASSR